MERGGEGKGRERDGKGNEGREMDKHGHGGKEVGGIRGWVRLGGWKGMVLISILASLVSHFKPCL